MKTHDDISIIPGRPADYASLARFHYRAPKPATCVHTLTAADTTSGEVIGVLTISMPTLNGPWRRDVWPSLFARADKRTNAARINRHLRTISRVIVDPRYRALGIARRLVEAYLGAPLTGYTETIAAMGRWCPFFEKAGMREVALPASLRDRALLRALEKVGVEPWELVSVDRAASVARGSAMVRDQLFEWARYSRATRGFVKGIKEGEEIEVFELLAVLAGARLTARPAVYVSGQ
jgi:GNAT superfamily N-acetyltransferase